MYMYIYIYIYLKNSNDKFITGLNAYCIGQQCGALLKGAHMLLAFFYAILPA